MKIKSVVSVLMALIILCCLCGCGGNGSSSKDSGKKKGPGKDAQVITIAKTAYYAEQDPWNADGEYGEAIREVLSEIESEYNVKINIDYYSPTEFLSIAQTAITNGDTEFADIMIHNLFQFGPLYAQGLLYDLGTLEGLNVKSSFWSEPIKNVASFKDGLYGIGSSGLNGYGGGNSLHYNRDMVKSLGLEDPIELVRSGKWTWDKLREYAVKAIKDNNNDGKFTDADRFGCTSVAFDGFCPVWLTAGVPTMVKDANNNLVYNMLNKDAVAALQKLKSVFTVNDGMFYYAGMDALVQQKQFLSGNAMFLLGKWTQEGEESGDFEIATLPYPKYKEEDDYVTPVFHNTTVISVPATTEKAELVGKILQLLGEKTKKFRKHLINDTSVNYVDREQYIEMATKYGEKISVDPFNIMLNVNESISMGTMRAIGMPIGSNSSYTQYTEGPSKKIQALLDEMFNK